MSHEDLPVGLILWAGNDSRHIEHLHVEGFPKQTGTPPTSNPGPTPSLRIILDALTERFNESSWGVWNRRRIDNDPDKPWSQHAYANAADIRRYNHPDPLVGPTEQRPWYDFLTGREEHAMYETIAGFKFYDVDEWPAWADASIREAISDGVIHGKAFDSSDPTKRLYDPNGPVTRAEIAVILRRGHVI